LGEAAAAAAAATPAATEGTASQAGAKEPAADIPVDAKSASVVASAGKK
jgi:hypothetical protein